MLFVAEHKCEQLKAHFAFRAILGNRVSRLWSREEASQSTFSTTGEQTEAEFAPRGPSGASWKRRPNTGGPHKQNTASQPESVSKPISFSFYIPKQETLFGTRSTFTFPKNTESAECKNNGPTQPLGVFCPFRTPSIGRNVQQPHADIGIVLRPTSGSKKQLPAVSR